MNPRTDGQSYSHDHISIANALDVLSHRPKATSRTRAWSGLTLDLHRPLLDCSVRYAAFDHHLICYCPSGRGRLVQGRGGTIHESIISSGTTLLMPAGYESTWEGDAPASARLRIPTSLIDAAAAQIGSRATSTFEIRNVFSTRDSTIERLALILLSELDRPPHPAQALIADQISCALAGHMLRSYNVFSAIEAIDGPALARTDLVRLTAFIEDNIDRPIGLEELSQIVKVSRFHFSRLFKRSTGMTPVRFVEQSRISRAKSLILETDIALAEIALMTGFADQSHFTRRFQRYVGLTPAAFAREQGRRRKVRGQIF